MINLSPAIGITQGATTLASSTTVTAVLIQINTASDTIGVTLQYGDGLPDSSFAINVTTGAWSISGLQTSSGTLSGSNLSSLATQFAGIWNQVEAAIVQAQAIGGATAAANTVA